MSERLDRSLSADDDAALNAHLAACGRCRSAERAYLEEQRVLRNLNEVPPPRDLWARTSTALDREITRHVGPGAPVAVRLRVGGGSASLLGVSTLAIASLALAVVGARIVADRKATPQDPASVLQAGSISSGSQELAVVNLGADGGVTVYQAAVGLACPQPVTECELDAVTTHQVLDVPTGQRPVGMSLHVGTRRLAVLAENARGVDTVSVVSLPPMRDLGPFRGAGPGPDGRWPPGVRPNASAATGIPGADPGDPDGADPADRLLAVLEGVRVTGAAPAWSPDGELLAFSAMPTDRSRGPDLYVWRAGDPKAQKLTNDHRTWFASWSMSRIVVSRTAPRTGGVDIRTVLIEPGSRRERHVRLDDAWLPVVDPVVDMRSRGVARWAAPSSNHDPGSARCTWSTGRRWIRRRPRARTTSAAQDRTRSGRPLRVPEPGCGPAEEPRARQGPGARLPPSAYVGGWLEAVEPERDGRLHPLLDWEVRWADDGRSFGYWIADAPGATWGQLIVHRLGESGAIERAATILGPTLARRSFTLGTSRVAWVAPSPDRPDGELRVRTWSGARRHDPDPRHRHAGTASSRSDPASDARSAAVTTGSGRFARSRRQSRPGGGSASDARSAAVTTGSGRFARSRRRSRPGGGETPSDARTAVRGASGGILTRVLHGPAP